MSLKRVLSRRVLSKANRKGRRILFAMPRSSEPVDSRNIHLISCIGVDLEAAMLGHFIDHYRSLGVPASNMHLVLNAADRQSVGLSKARQVMADRGLVAEEIWIGEYTSARMWQKRRDVQRRCVPAGCWIISADVDEFHEYPEPLPEFLAECAENGVNCIDGVFIDRVTADGSLAEVTAEPSLDHQFPLKTMVQGRIVPFGQFHQASGSVKLMAFDAALVPDRGGHRLVKHQGDARYLFGRSLTEFPQIVSPALRFRMPLKVHHFKWQAPLLTTLHRRLASPGVSEAGREYGQKLLDYLAASDGRINPADIVFKPSDQSDHRPTWRVFVRLMRGMHFGRLAGSRIKSKLS